MTSEKGRRTGLTAAELMARLEADPQFRAAEAARSAELAQRASVLALAEAPIVADLNRAGVVVQSVWDLVNTGDPYPAAVPVLLAHLRGGTYPDRVKESIGRALAVSDASPYWETLRGLYLRASGPGEREGLAVALSGSAASANIGDLEELIHDPDLGSSRVHLVGAIRRVGGPRGKEIIEKLVEDPVLGREARAKLPKRKPPKPARDASKSRRE